MSGTECSEARKCQRKLNCLNGLVRLFQRRAQFWDPIGSHLPVVIAVKIPLPTSPSAVECEDGVDRWVSCRSKGVRGRQPCAPPPPFLPDEACVYTWTPVCSSHSL